MRTIVVGGAGFVGSHLADYLIEQGHQVLIVDNLSTGHILNVNPFATFFQADIRNLKQLQIIFNDCKPDWVFHEAANARTQLSVDDPAFNNDVNITGTLNVLIAARDAGAKKVIFASSCILNAPNTPYYVSKLAGEEYMKVFQKLYNLPTICLRYSNVYGSTRQSEKGVSLNALASLKKTKRETGRIWLTGDGTQVRDWTHVRDIARANLMAAQSEVTGVYDICTGKEVSMNEIAQYFQCPVDYIPARSGDAHSLSSNQNPEPALRDFGYKYEIEFNQESLRPYLD